MEPTNEGVKMNVVEEVAVEVTPVEATPEVAVESPVEAEASADESNPDTLQVGA